jgi:hypothetical protein
MTRLLTSLVVALILFSVSVGHTLAAGWSPEAAARYLDARQKAWFEWKPAQSADGPCVSCHTGMTYLLARPALRRALGESGPTIYERGLLNRLRAQAGAKPAAPLRDVEIIFAAYFLAREDAGGPLSPETTRTFDQLRAIQKQDGAAAGGFGWYSADLDPWEHPGSHVFGSAMAMLALRTEGRAAPSDVANFLTRAAAGATLHDRLAALWAGQADPAAVAETLKRQSEDGGWTNEALGPWMAHADAPVVTGSTGYATAFTTFALLKGGVPASDRRIARALEWLKAHQDPSTGAWPAVSMNKQRPAGSMEALFMQDAATAFASLALLDAGQ